MRLHSVCYYLVIKQQSQIKVIRQFVTYADDDELLNFNPILETSKRGSGNRKARTPRLELGKTRGPHVW